MDKRNILATFYPSNFLEISAIQHSIAMILLMGKLTNENISYGNIIKELRSIKNQRNPIAKVFNTYVGIISDKNVKAIYNNELKKSEKTVTGFRIGDLAFDKNFVHYRKNKHHVSDKEFSEGRIAFEEIQLDDGMLATFRYYESGATIKEKWTKNSRPHRDNDYPAIILYYPNGLVQKQSWYIHGIERNDLPAHIEYNEQGVMI